jgi:hypothetical protein
MLFVLCPLVFLCELVLLGILHHPTIPLFKLTALTAIVLHKLPWWGYIYLLAWISLSSFVHGFSVPIDLMLIMFVILAMVSYFHNLLVHHLIAQSFMIIFFTFICMAFDCFFCLTVSNILATILIVPFMVYCLR